MKFAFFFIAVLLAAIRPVTGAVPALGTISIAPSNPTTDDSVFVIFTPTPGFADECPLSVSIVGNTVGIFAGPCGDSASPNIAGLGKLPAGAYDVIWGAQDNFAQNPEPTATFVVIQALVQAPALSPFGGFLLAIGLWLLLLARDGPNYSCMDSSCKCMA